MNNPTPNKAFGPAVCRISDVMAHMDRYAFKGVTRLARDARVSASSVSRILNGKLNPSFVMVARLTNAIEERLGTSIDPRDLIAENGEFLRRYVCDLAGCSGCLPDNARDEFGDIKAAFHGVSPGAWVSSRHPKGFVVGQEGEHD